jgi:hypothetical protein
MSSADRLGEHAVLRVNVDGELGAEVLSRTARFAECISLAVSGDGGDRCFADDTPSILTDLWFGDHFTRDNFNGDGKIDVIVLATDKGEVAIHCGPTVLANQMRSAAPAFGEKIGVKYLGTVSRSGSPDYHDYRVVTDRSKGGQIHWAGEPDEVADYVEPQKQEVRHEAGASPVSDESDIPFGPSIF